LFSRVAAPNTAQICVKKADTWPGSIDGAPHGAALDDIGS